MVQAEERCPEGRALEPGMGEGGVRKWRPAQFLDTYTDENAATYVVIVLNVPIRRRQHFIAVCQRARRVICADGGANRIRALALSTEEEKRCVRRPGRAELY